jgi:hypothetical protein
VGPVEGCNKERLEGESIIQCGFYSLAWYFMSVIPELRRRRQKNTEFKASLGYVRRHCLKKKRKVIF